MSADHSGKWDAGQGLDWNRKNRQRWNMHRRRSIRLPSFDYSSPNAYFVTICTVQRRCLFGEIVNGEMRLNEVGRIVQKTWNELPDRYHNIEIDAFIIMPNHIHGIIRMLEPTYPVGAPLAGAPPLVRIPRRTDGNERSDMVGRSERAGARPAPTVGAGMGITVCNVIGGFKSISTVGYIRYQKSIHPIDIVSKLWHRNYYERVIRSERELLAVRKYIQNNPTKWEEKDLYS